MRTTESLVKRVLQPQVSLTANQSFAVEMELAKLSVRVSSYTDFYKHLMFLPCQVRKGFKDEVYKDFDVMVGLKFAMLSALRQSKCDARSCRSVFNDYGMSSHWPIIDGFKAERIFGKVVKQAKSVSKDALVPLDTMRRECSDMVERLRPYIAKYVARKLRFIVTSNNLNNFDIEGEIVEKAIRAYYRAVPFVTGEHLLNTLKKAVASRGTNLIHYYQADKRRRLSDAGDGSYQNTVIGLNITDDEGVEQENQFVMFHASKLTTDDLQSHYWYMEFMKKRFASQPVKSRVLHLLTCTDDEAFNQFLSDKYEDKNCNPLVVIERFGKDTLLDNMREHLKVDPASFFGFVRLVLAG